MQKKLDYKLPNSLYSTSEIEAIRDILAEQQKGIDPILKVPFKEAKCLDHDHETQKIRGVLGRNSNAFEGKVFNAYVRCMRWLTDIPLPELLRNLADYLETDVKHLPYHPAWLKRVKTDFNILTAAQQNSLLLSLGGGIEANKEKRNASFSKILLQRDYTFDDIKEKFKCVHAISQ